MSAPGVSDEDGDWYGSWVQQHAFATGAPDGTAAALEAARERLCATHRASGRELGNCTLRLIEYGRVPATADEHAGAVERELPRMRAEFAAPPRHSAPRADGCPGGGARQGRPDRPDSPARGGRG